MFWNDIFYSTEKFERYSLEYFTILTIYLLVGTAIIWYGNKASERSKTQLLKGMSYVISSMIIIWAIIEIALGRFYLASDLPLIFCNFFALILPLYLIYRNQFSFNILYYIILAGAIQAIITPGLKFSFPHYEFIKFWTVHMGLIIFIFFNMIVNGMRPTSKGMLHSFLFVQVYMVLIIFINWILDSNYLYLNVKPEHGTLLDKLGGWPYYIIWMDLILIPYFFILYLPVWIINKYKRGKNL